jgi:hypothetical protein
MPKVSVIIVSWNVCDLLRDCLESIYTNAGGLSLDILVVDSDSHDGTLAMLEQSFPQVTVLAQAENVGFTKGNNIGLRIAQGDYLILLNPDTKIIGDALNTLITYMDAHSKVGIVGPHTLNEDGTTQSTRRRFPTLLTGIFESTWLQAIAPKTILRRYYMSDTSDSAALDVDWVQGSAMLVRRAVYEQIGGLDEGYVMYSEELDWCKRAKLAGWSVAYIGSASIIHYGGKSSEQVIASSHIWFQRSKLRYFRKYHGWFAAQFLRLVLLLNYVVQLIIEAFKRLLGRKPDLREERIKTYWQVLRSGLKVS